MISTREMVYYYERLSIRGICLTLLAEFEKESPDYDLVRMERPSDDPNIARLLNEQNAQRIAEFDDQVAGLMTKPPDLMEEGTEVLTREGLLNLPNVMTSRVRSGAIAGDVSRNGNKRSNPEKILSDGDGDLEHQPLKKLKEISFSEGVIFKGSRAPRRKQEYIAAIIANRCNH